MAKQRRRAAPPTRTRKATARKGSAPKTARTARSGNSSSRTSGAAKAKARKAAPSRAAGPSRTATRPRPAASSRTATPARTPTPSRAAATQAAPSPPPTPAPPPAPPRKPGFYEAVAIYERGVQALQRREYPTAADLFRAVIERYPEERELLERARLYLSVCERETNRQPPPPQSARDHIYAATVALNSGDHGGAMGHLQRALTADADDDHAHYMMAAALSVKGRSDEALQHLQRAIALNPENRTQARQDPDLDRLRQHHAFQSVLDTPADPSRRRVGSSRG